MQEVYFNIHRKQHILFLSELNKMCDKNAKYQFIKYGDGVQHLFKDGKYLMTVNWNLI